MAGEDHVQCRYCFEQESPHEGSLADVLIQPCACSGSVAYAHVSCLYRWQLAKAERFGSIDHCEVCRCQYRIPHGAVDALVAEGHLPPPPRHMRLWRVAGPRMEWLYRLLGPVFRLLEGFVVLVGAADYALRAHHMAPDVLADPPACLRPFAWEIGVAAATLLAFPAVYAVRANDQAVQMRRLQRGLLALKVFYHSCTATAVFLLHARFMARIAGDPSASPYWRQDARAALELDCLVVRCALPVAAAFVGACSAWWRLVLCLAWPSRLEAEAAALSAACHRLAAFARWVVARTGVLPHMQAAAAALGSSAAAQQLVGWGRWAAGLLLAQGASPVAAAKAAAKGVPLPRGPLQELLWGIEKRGGLDAAGAFSA